MSTRLIQARGSVEIVKLLMRIGLNIFSTEYSDQNENAGKLKDLLYRGVEMKFPYRTFLIIFVMLSLDIIANEGNSSNIDVQVKPNFLKPFKLTSVDEYIDGKKNFKDKKLGQEKFINFDFEKRLAAFNNDVDFSQLLLVPSLSILWLMNAEKNGPTYKMKQDMPKTSLDLIDGKQINLR